MQSRLDEELKALLEESIDLTWNEYCKTCQAENEYSVSTNHTIMETSNESINC